MALFVDGPASTIDDLTDQDSGLLDVSQTCGINVTTKLRLAHEEIATDLQLWLNRPRPTLELVWGPVLRIEQVVMTPTLKQWETMLGLTLFYRDAYFSQLADRYQAKWNEYSNLARSAYERFVATGLGLVSIPVGRALPPALATVPGAQSGGTYYASVAWVNSTGQEGAVSDASSLTFADGNVLSVAAAGSAANSVGFNVYAGTSLNGMLRQNATPLPIGASFTYVPGAPGSGILPGKGQMPDFIRPLARTWLRG